MNSRTVQAVGRLQEIMATLRSPGGCPWDAEQTPESLRPYIVEEAYEVLEAIDRGEPAAVRDELGDLLLQVVFQARIFEERRAFDLGDVAQAIADKLVRRHPHVFGAAKREPGQPHEAHWDRIKAQEKAARGEPAGALGGVPPHLPALLRARKLAERAERAGFDRPEADEIIARVQEELTAFGQAARSGDRKGMTEELGNLLFTVVNLGRNHRIDAEEALRSTLDRFIKHFERIEPFLDREEQNRQPATPAECEAPQRTDGGRDARLEEGKT